MLAAHESVWVIGGGAVYAAFLPHADRLVVTDVDTRGRRRHLGARDRTPSGSGPARTPDDGLVGLERTGLRLRGVSEYARVAVGRRAE